MTLKWRVFMIWLASSYFFCVVVVPVMLRLFGRDVSVASFFHWKTQLFLVASCATPAAVGTFILWVLPIRGTLLGIIAGLILSVAGIVLWAWFEVSFFPGFEANAGYYALSL